ncbi:MAG: flagellar motor switch protein FliG [Planctomycetes bacterium]|nr:flagellar motor switch protein FliG [Planctomycetota bacterium]
MDHVEKAAILLLSLDKPLAAEVMSQLPKPMVEAVTLRIAQLGNVSREKQESVFEEFYEVANDATPIERGGIDFANDLLQQSLGADGASAILENVRQSMSSIPFSFLQKVGVDNLMTFIAEEHTQTIALILSHVPPQLAADVIGGLSVEKQLDVIRRIASMEQTSPEVVKDVEASLESRMKTTFNQQMEKAGGVPAVAQILNVTDRMTNKGILEHLEEDDAELVDEIRRLMFVFDDLLKLDDKSIQTLLKEVDNSQWATALKGASEEIKQRVMSNLSQRAAETLKEDMDYLGPVRVSDVENMQQQIVDTVRRLEDAGEIEISAAGEAEEYIT